MCDEEYFNDFEVTLQEISRNLIVEFLENNPEYLPLKKSQVKLWKFLAEENGPISWSEGEDDQMERFSMYVVADQLLNDYDECLSAYDLFLHPIEPEQS